MPIEVDEPSDVSTLAARVREMGEVAVLASSAEGRSFVAAGAVETSHAYVPEPQSLIRKGPLDAAGRDSPSDAWASVPRWIGLLPYEAARCLERTPVGRADARPRPHHELPCWKRYPAVAVVDHAAGRVTVVGDNADAERRLARAISQPHDGEGQPGPRASLLPLGPDEPAIVHEERIREALSLVAAGDLYQVNVARRYTFQVMGKGTDIFRQMRRYAPTSYGFYCEFDDVMVIGTSPELFLQALPDGRVLTAPIKGTRPRGDDRLSDAAHGRALDADEKERAELLMVIDLERNDLGRVSVTGSVRVPFPPRIERHTSLFHRVADVRGLLRTDVSREQLLRATFPSGSVTGAPKVRAMEVIASLEAHRRGLYTGAYGYLGRDGRVVLSIAIRTLTVRDGEGHYQAGGGIVDGSDPAREVEETRTKALQVAALVSGATRRGP